MTKVTVRKEGVLKLLIEPQYEISDNVVCATNKASDQPCAYAQSDQSDLEILSLTRGCTGLSESTLVKMPHCWKLHVAAQLVC